MIHTRSVLLMGLIKGKIPALSLLYLSLGSRHGDACRHFFALTVC